jgi:hypothetical protein
MEVGNEKSLITFNRHNEFHFCLEGKRIFTSNKDIPGNLEENFSTNGEWM